MALSPPGAPLLSDHSRAEGRGRTWWACGFVLVSWGVGGLGWILQLKTIKSTSEEFFTKLDDGLTVPEYSHNLCSCAVLEKKASWKRKETMLLNSSSIPMFISRHTIIRTHFSLMLIH